MRFSRKYLILAPIRSHFHVCPARGSETAPFFVCGIKIDAAFWTEISALASKLMPLRAPSLIPSGRSHLSRCFWKNIQKFCCCAGIRLLPLHLLHVWKPFCAPLKKIPSPNPRLEIVFSTYPPRISPTIPYSNFCNWKTTRFLKKFSLNPIPQLSKPKNDIFSETFSKNVLTPLPHVFGQKTDTLFQKSFLLLYRKFFRANLNCDFEKIPLTYLDWKQNLPTLL